MSTPSRPGSSSGGGNREYKLTRRFGLEYEFGVPNEGNEEQTRASAATTLGQRSGQRCTFMDYTHAVHDHWKIVTDSSVQVPNYTGLELVSPPLSGQEGLNTMVRMLRAVESMRPNVNKSAGHHVHIDGRDLSLLEVKKICAAFIVYERAFDILTSRSRQDTLNEYCQSNRAVLIRNSGGTEAGALERLRQAASKEQVVAMMNPNEGRGSRYFKLNITNLTGGRGHGTIEFRQHQGTFEAVKSLRWVELLQRFVENARKDDFIVPRTLPSYGALWLDMMYKKVMRKHLTEYYFQRITKLDEQADQRREPRVIRTTEQERRTLSQVIHSTPRVGSRPSTARS